MSPVEVGLVVQLVLLVVGLLAALAPAGVRSRVAGLACAALGVGGAATGAAAMAGGSGALSLPLALPLVGGLDPVRLAPTPLGGVFLLVAGAVGALAAVYGIGYTHGPAASRSGWAAFAVFLAGMQLVPAAGDVVSFLLAWELMALASTVLLLAEHARRPAVRSAAVWYAVMTHLSFVLLLGGFAVLAAAAGGTSFARLAAAGASGGTADVAFLLLAGGFVTKAGLVPVHVWLPRAHPEAPSHVSAAMSAAMVKMGVYGLMLLVLQLLPAWPAWWGLVLLALGAVSAVFGILQASVASDLKRLLAYSTTENVGLMVTALAVAMLLAGAGQAGVADVALTAVLLLVVSHAAFKLVLFLAAGSVLHATGERSLDRMGGLAGPMPTTGAAFGVAALGAAALPVTCGFAAEWTLLQSLVHGATEGDTLLAVILPITVGVVALTAGLALLTFVKAHGIAFLARPRSPGALAAHEASASMRVAMGVGAVLVLGIGLAPGPVAAALAGTVGASGVTSVGLAGLDLPAVSALLDPTALLLLGNGLTLPVLIAHVAAARRHPRRPVPLAWGCGGVRVSPTMQYTATSYAEPLVRVFDDALRPTRDLAVTHAEESAYVVRQVAFRQRLSDVVADRAYAPMVAGMGRLGRFAARLQNGSIHRYLMFSFTALVVVLLVVAA